MTVLQAEPFACFEVVVVGVRRLSPSYVRVTFGGEALHGFDGCGPLGPRDLRVKLVVPVEGGRVEPVHDLARGWYPRWLARDPLLRGEMRTFTVRQARLDGPSPELDVDLVLHGPSGPAGRWAASVGTGDPAVLLGPGRGRWRDYGGIEWSPPPAPASVLLAGDETAVPAVASVLATLPPGYDGRAVLEVPEPGDFQQLACDADVAVTWLARGARPHGELLTAVVRDTGPASYAWLAGEAAVVRGLRRLLVRERGMAREAVTFLGYWRRGHNAG